MGPERSKLQLLSTSAVFMQAFENSSIEEAACNICYKLWKDAVLEINYH